MALFVYLIMRLALLIAWGAMVWHERYWWSVAPLLIFVMTRWPKAEVHSATLLRIAEWSDDQVAAVDAGSRARSLSRRALGIKEPKK